MIFNIGKKCFTRHLHRVAMHVIASIRQQTGKTCSKIVYAVCASVYLCPASIEFCVRGVCVSVYLCPASMYLCPTSGLVDNRNDKTRACKLTHTYIHTHTHTYIHTRATRVCGLIVREHIL